MSALRRACLSVVLSWVGSLRQLEDSSSQSWADSGLFLTRDLHQQSLASLRFTHGSKPQTYLRLENRRWGTQSVGL